MMEDKPNTMKRSLKPWLNLIPDFRKGSLVMVTPPQEDSVTSDIGSYIQYSRSIEGADNEHITAHFCPDPPANPPTHIPRPTPVRPAARSHASSRGFIPTLAPVPSEGVSDHVSSRGSLLSARSTGRLGDPSLHMTDMEYILTIPALNHRYPPFPPNSPKYIPDASSCGCCNLNTTGEASYCATTSSYADRHTGFLPASLDIPHVIPTTTRFTLEDSSVGSLSQPPSLANSRPGSGSGSTSTPSTVPPNTPPDTQPDHNSPAPSRTPSDSPQIVSVRGSDGSSDDPEVAIAKANPSRNLMDQKRPTLFQQFLYNLLPYQWRILASTTPSSSSPSPSSDLPSPSSSSSNLRSSQTESPILMYDSDIDWTWTPKTDEEKQADEKLRKEWWLRQKIQTLVLVLVICLVIAGVGIAFYYGTTPAGRG